MARRGKKQKRIKRHRGPRSGIGLAKFLLPGTALLGIVMVMALAALAWLQFGRHQELTEQRLANLLADQQATLVSQRVRGVVELAEQLAAMPALRAGQSAAALATLEARLGAMLPAVQIRLMTPARVPADEGLPFSAQDAVRRAREAGGTVLAVAPKPEATLFIARQTPSGVVLLLGAPLRDLRRALARDAIDNVASSLLLDGNTVVFAHGNIHQPGRHAQRQAEAGLSVSVVVPRGASDPALLLLFGSIGGAAFALVLLVWLSTLLAMGRGLRKDGALLTHLAEDLMRSRLAQPRSEFTYPVLERAAEAVRNAMQNTVRPTAAFHDDVVPDDVALLLEEGGTTEAQPARPEQVRVPASVFREYDIRGQADLELTDGFARHLGQAIGSEVLDAGERKVVVARDGRLSSPALSRALIAGITSTGADVLDVGMVPTPMLSWATTNLDTGSGVCVTGSHNPAAANGFKITVAGTALHGDRIRALRTRIENGDTRSGMGAVTDADVAARYMDELVADISIARPVRVALDCGNGVTGRYAPEILRRLGCEVVELFTEVDGHFPNHTPDTSDPAAYEALLEVLAEDRAEIGIMLDGDGDRIGVAVKDEIVWADRLMMLFARDLLTREPGAEIIFDVKCSRHLTKLISTCGGKPVMWKTGHSLVREKLREHKALLAGEMSGHIFFADRWHGFDDGIYAAARLLEIVSRDSRTPQGIFAGLATGIVTPEIRVPVKEQVKFALVEQLRQQADRFGGTPVMIDGLRVDFEDGWGLVRASNTGALLTIRFEGDDASALKRIQGIFRERLLAVNPQLKLPF